MPRPAHPRPLRIAAPAALALAVLLAGPLAAHAGPPDPLAAVSADTTARPRPVAWRSIAPGPDKLQHAGLSFGLAAGVGIAARAPWPGAGVSLGFGVVKELADRRHGRFDPLDLTADAVGAVLGALVTRSLVR